MAKIRIAIEINKGRIGAPLRKLALVYENLNRFFSYAAEDLNIDLVSEFQAVDFRNGSVGCVVQLPADINENDVALYRGEVEALIAFHPDTTTNISRWMGRLTPRTLDQYSKLGQHLDFDEPVEISFIEAANDYEWDNLSWKRITKEHTRQISEIITEHINYYGAIFGKIHALMKESERPHIQIREALSKAIVNVYFRSSDYEAVVKLLDDHDALIHVAGIIHADRVKNEIVSVEGERYRVAPRFSEGDLKRLAGQTLTGDITTDEFISLIRDDDGKPNG